RALCRSDHLRLADAAALDAWPCRLRLRPARPRRRQEKLKPQQLNPFLTFKRRTAMEVILLERISKLGQMGDVVRVKDGYGRNFLLPQGKALRATDANKAKFETMKVDLQAKNLATKAEADKIGSKLDGKGFPVLRQASETGQLYGSVSPRDL